MAWFARFVQMFIVFVLTAIQLGCGGDGGGGTAAVPPGGEPSVTYTVRYDGNGSTAGEVPSDSNAYQQSQSVTVLGNPGGLLKEGFVFTGWNTQADGTGATYTESRTFSMGTADVTLYAKWTAHPTYAVTYNGNGSTAGAVPADASCYEQGQTVTVLANLGGLAKNGYAFSGWNTQADGNGATYTASQHFTMGAGDVTLYAKWTANPTYTVTYSGNANTSGDVPVDTARYEQAQPVTVLANTGNLARSGYTFAGWNTQADGSGSTYTPTQSFAMGAQDVTLFAKWTLNPTYSVTYVGNGNTSGVVPADSLRYEAGQIVTVLGNTQDLARTGYAFAGWNTRADGNGGAYRPGSELVMGPLNLSLYAQWDELLMPTVTSITPAQAYSTVSTPNVKIQGTGFTASTVIRIGSVEMPSGNCFVNSATLITCTIPAAANATTSGSFDVTADNGRGASSSLTGAWQYIAVLNGTGATAEADYCVNASADVVSFEGQPAEYFGEVYEPDFTEANGASSSVTAEVGYGPYGTNPITHPAGWVFFPATYSRQVSVRLDEYFASVISPAAGTYSVVFRFSIGGAGYTYCDKYGSGTITSGFDPAEMTRMHVVAY